MVLEILFYSRKFLGLILLILYVAVTYITYQFSYESIIYGTIAVFIILGYLAYYAHLHRSSKEVLALTTFTSLTMILGALTGLAINGFDNVGSLMYSLTLTLALTMLVTLLSKLYKI